MQSTSTIGSGNLWEGSHSSSNFPTSSSSSSSSSSADPFEGFDIHQASPREKREKFSQLVQRMVTSQDVNWRLQYQTHKTETTQNNFLRIVEYQNQLTGVLVVGLATLGYGGWSTVASIDKTVGLVCEEIRKDCLQYLKIDLLNLKTNLKSSVTAPEWPRTPPMPIALAILGAGLAIYVTGVDFKVFSDELNQAILQAFNRINDQHPKEKITAQQLLEQTIRIIRRKEESWFGRIFEGRNPIPMSCLLYTKAIALDSLGSHAEAQLDYEAALSFRYDYHHIIEDMIHFAYARSLRLSGKPSDTILAQIDRIRADSPIHGPAQIERMIVNNTDYTEQFDQNETPHHFICPITQEAMVEPVFHEFEGEFSCCYFERNAIVTWLIKHKTQTCPCCLKNITIHVNNYLLFPENNLKRSIQLWNQTRLIR